MSQSLRFGCFEFLPDESDLLVDGKPATLGRRALALLKVLIERRGKVVTKSELLDVVWPRMVVEENNVQVQVAALRKVLGPAAIATVPGRGYRFALDAETMPEPAPKGVGPAAATDQHSITRCGNLPHRLAPLYGRAADQQAAAELMQRYPVLTIAGTGGIGKTRLAQELAAQVAGQHADGEWWIELAPLSDPALVATTVAQATGLQRANAVDPLAALAEALADKQALLVLDNCEHLIDAVADLVAAITSAAPGVRLLLTSQEPMKSVDEQVYRLGALAVPPPDAGAAASDFGAVELFVARMKAVAPRLEPTAAKQSTVAEICRRLDGIPLAIELAAARVPLLGLEGLLARLDDCFSVLTAGFRMRLRRHQTLRATLEWSHGLLGIDEQAVFRRLGVFVGSFTIEALQFVAADALIPAWATLDHLGALVDKSLVLAEGDPMPRYRLLETTRSYALERLAESGETTATMRRHAQALVTMMRSVYEGSDRWQWTPQQWRAEAAEIDNLSAALDWASASEPLDPLAFELGAFCYRVFLRANLSGEGLRRLLAIYPHLDDKVPAPVAARFLYGLAWLGQTSGRAECFEAAGRAVTLFRELGDASWLYDALTLRAGTGTRHGQVELVRAALDDAASIEEAAWPPRQRAAFQWASFIAFEMQGYHEQALAAAWNQTELYRCEGIELGVLIGQGNVATAENSLGRMTTVVSRLRDVLARAQAIGRGAQIGHARSELVLALTLLGEHDEAIAQGRLCLPALRAEGEQYGLFDPLALNAAQAGRLHDAARIVGYGDAIFKSIGLVRRPRQRERRERIEALLEGGLPAAEAGRLKLEGEQLSEPQIFALCFGDGAPD